MKRLFFVFAVCLGLSQVATAAPIVSLTCGEVPFRHCLLHAQNVIFNSELKRDILYDLDRDEAMNAVQKIAPALHPANDEQCEAIKKYFAKAIAARGDVISCKKSLTEEGFYAEGFYVLVY